MPSVIVWAMAMVVMMAESVLLEVFAAPGWAVQTPIAIAIYLGLDRDFVSGGLILLALLLPVEWMVGGMYGVYSLGLVAVFFAMCTLRANLQTQWGVARAIVVAMAVPLHSVVMLAVLFLAGESGGRVTALIGVHMWTAIPLVVVVTMVMGRGFARLEKMMDSRGGRPGLEF